MKKTHIISIVIIAAAIVFLVSMLSNSSTYADFSEAAKLGPDEDVHVAGQLVRTKPMEYNPQVDPNRFVFYMTDRNNVERKVVLLKSKPQDFERTPQVVAIGSMKGNEFVAKDVLMKCPSKYNDGKGEMANK
jgi:cytochrome c-type biogenesis protein CcmE